MLLDTFWQIFWINEQVVKLWASGIVKTVRRRLEYLVWNEIWEKNDVLRIKVENREEEKKTSVSIRIIKSVRCRLEYIIWFRTEWRFVYKNCRAILAQCAPGITKKIFFALYRQSTNICHLNSGPVMGAAQSTTPLPSYPLATVSLRTHRNNIIFRFVRGQ